jgi:ATP-binding protein involved in chromosome partitioning
LRFGLDFKIIINISFKAIIMIDELNQVVRTFFADKLNINLVRGVCVDNDRVKLNFPAQMFKHDLDALLISKGEKRVIENTTIAHTVKTPLKRHTQIKNVIAVASGKGGVGKSTVAVNLAIGLQQQGASVGLLDADIYGPSCALMLGVDSHPVQNQDEGIPPICVFGLQTISIAYLIESDKTPMIWRGPMVSRALEQLFFNSQWHDLDYLIIDMPPGTGDIALTLMQKIPLTATVIVTTPQDLSLLDAKKALTMCNKLQIPVLGVVENMSSYCCSQCGHTEAIFGSLGGSLLAKDSGIPLLAQLPLAIEMREQTDNGKPCALQSDAYGLQYHLLAIKVAALLSQINPDYSSKFPNIVIKE